MEVGVDSFAAAFDEAGTSSESPSERLRNLIEQIEHADEVGLDSLVDAFPLFGLSLDDYDSLFAEKLELLLNIRENEHVHYRMSATA